MAYFFGPPCVTGNITAMSHINTYTKHNTDDCFINSNMTLKRQWLRSGPRTAFARKCYHIELKNSVTLFDSNTKFQQVYFLKPGLILSIAQVAASQKSSGKLT